MNKLSLMILSVLFVGANVHASGIKQSLYQCGRVAGESATTIQADLLTGSAPGGPQWTSYHASVSDGGPVTGLHYSGYLTIEHKIDSETGIESFASEDQGFTLNILQKRYVLRRGTSLLVQVEAQYIDVNTGEKQILSPVWLSCK